MKDLFETLSAMSHRQSDLLLAGLSPEEATRIAFNPNNESAILTEDEMQTVGLKMAFMYGMRYRKHVKSGMVITDEDEAVNEAINIIKQLLNN